MILHAGRVENRRRRGPRSAADELYNPVAAGVGRIFAAPGGVLVRGAPRPRPYSGVAASRTRNSATAAFTADN
ncbi:hypothetical protein ACFV0W_20685, partial [Streptomyces anulatus]